MGELKDRHKAFIDEYLLNGRNATQAYLKVYPDCKSEDGARASSSKLLTNPNVLEYLKEEEEYLRKQSRVSKEDILEMHKQIAELTRYDINHCHKAIKAASEISRMLGYYEAEKHEHSGGLINFNLKLDEE